VDLKMLIVSWNLMECAPADGEIAELAKATGFDTGDIDIVVVGEQETKTKDAHVYIPQRLKATRPPGDYCSGEGDPKKDGGDWGKSRQTATATVGSRVLTCGATWVGELKPPAGPDVRFLREKVKGKRKGLVFYTAKGGCVLYMDIGNRRLAFVSCHLNDASTVKRDAEVAQILAEVKKSDADAIFLFGDLNYRPRFLEDVKTKAPVPKDLKVGFEAGDLPDVFTTFANLHTLHAEHDVFGNKTAALVKEHGFTFPAPNFYPTYKRKTVGRGKLPDVMPTAPNVAACRAYYDVPTKGSVEGYTDTEGKPIPMQSAGEVKKARYGEYAVGWLDRVGYKMVKDVAIKDVKFAACPNLGKSDHAPVYLRCALVLDPEK